MNTTTISVVGKHNVKHPKEIYRFIRELNPHMAKFIPCYNFDEHGKTERLGIRPLEYADFICSIFDCWMHDLPTMNDDRWLVIDPIATIIASIRHSVVQWCEYRREKCENFLNILPNGDLWLCDTFNQDLHRKSGYRGNLFEMTDDELMRIITDTQELFDYFQFKEDLMRECDSCSVNEICNGGCLPLRHVMRTISDELAVEHCEAKRKTIRRIKEVVEYAMLES